ncbi:MAG: HAMP domain-containing histidine kinase [Clostridia bacterium]|nr:HAMP domain-containing histidine kinase [Clostridia bacterium]
MKKRNKISSLLQAVYHFFVFFFVVAFVISCCLMLFVSTLQTTMGVVFTQEQISAAAKMTMVNAIVISLLFAAVDAVRRKWTIQRPAQQITRAAEQMIRGDFSVRIQPTASFFTDDTFREITNCINKMAEELSGVETLRTDFIANVSHEMKTPLAAIRNYGVLLQAPDVSREQRMEYAKAITDSSRRLSDMMTNILKLNRLENQQIYPNFQTYDLGEQLCEELLQYESVWEEKGIEIETEMAEGVLVCADAELLSLVWSNLFSNAFKFTASGGKVTLFLEETEECAVVKVRDTGCGMTPEVGAHIFEKFYQGDSSHSTQGNGLGLPLVKRVIDILQGEIGVESTPGSGTTFTVTIRKGQV